jgi:citronellol/citronellal dehydrogenase
VLITGRFDGRVVVVTGSSRGLGKSLAKTFARQGAAVVVAARTERAEQSKLPGTIHDTAREIRASGGRALPVACDVTKPEQIDAMVAEVIGKLGRIDVLVNNAGVLVAAPTAEMNPKHAELMFRINFWGVFYATRAVLPSMKELGRGNILNITAHAATNDLGPIAVYGATKAAVNRITVGLAHELRPFGIAVNALGPGLIETEGAQFGRPPGTPMPPDFSPPDVADEPALYLAAQTAATCTGRVVEVWEWQKTWP